MNQTNQYITVEQKQKILIISNSEERGEVFLKTLEKGYNVYAQKVGPEVYQIAGIIKPSLIIIDGNQLSNSAFFNILKTIETQPSLNTIPLAFLIEDTEILDELMSKELGAIYSGDIKTEDFYSFVKTILDNSNYSIISRDKNINYFVCFNEQSKVEHLRNIVLNDEIHSEPVVILSWRRGSDFFKDDPEAELLLEEDLITYLEIKPSLISKFPYMSDPTPIINEMIQFCPHELSKCHLVFEEPRQLLNIHLKESSISKAYILSTLLNTTFKKISYVNTKPQEKSAALFVNKIGKILTGTSGA